MGMFQDLFDDSYSLLEEALGEDATFWSDGNTQNPGTAMTGVVFKRGQLQGDNSRPGDGRWPDTRDGTTVRDTGEVTLDRSIEVNLFPANNLSGASRIQFDGATGKLWAFTREMRRVGSKVTYLVIHVEFVRSEKRGRRP